MNKQKITKKMIQMYQNYKNSENWSVTDAYASPSCKKMEIEKEIKKEMQAQNGTDYKICTKNINCFTCAYKIQKEQNIYLVYHTPTTKNIFKIFENGRELINEQ